MKKNIILITIFIILLISIIFFNKKENIITNLTFNQIEDKNTPLNYKKEYTFTIKELSNKKNSLQFYAINHYVEVYINDKLIYELKDDKISEKNKLIKIEINKKYINKKVKIILTPLNKEDINNNLNLEIK